MSDKIEHDFSAFDGISSGHNTNTIPIQMLPSSSKTLSWKKATIDSLERNGINQLYKNIRFNAYRKMTNGLFTYQGTGVSDNEDFDMPWFNNHLEKLRKGNNIPSYIKHFDFIGIVVNALSGIFANLNDKFRVESIDEYFTNEYIRQKTELLHKYAQETFLNEVNKLLLQRGIDVNKNDFNSQEEADAYKQEIQAQTKALTPEEIEQNLSKNFKILATEWGQNVLTADKKRFNLSSLERDEFIDYLLTGRYFRHYRVGFDSYNIERWLPEEVFFSQDVHAKFPQNGEYCGRITSMSASDVLNRFGHLMTTKEQEAVGNYWNQTKNYTNINGANIEKGTAEFFPKPTTVPFHNYYDHKANLQLEEALGVPLGIRTEMDAEGNPINTPTYIPREETEINFYANTFAQVLRDDIDVRRDTIRVTEVYWRSYKRMAVVVYENKFGTLSVDLVTDEILDDFLEDNEIKTKRNLSLQELQKALIDGNLDEYKNTITYFYAPEVWKGIKIKGNGSTLKKDLYLDVSPLEYQIKGDSNIYDVNLPVSGLIDVGIASKLAPYQQLHNICMNQITGLLEKELGVFFTFDITGLPSAYQDEDTTESLFKIREDIKDSGLFGLDLSRQNTQGNNPNIFQRQEIVYATQVQYRWQLAQQYKQEALSQIGITPQLLGQASTYETAQGVKEGAQAKFSLLNQLFDKFNEAKAKGMEVHLAVAQFCEVNGKDTSTLIRKSDGDLSFLNIMEEDGEIFPLRKLGIVPETNSNDRKIIEEIKQFVLNDNTIDRSYEDVISILTNPVLAEIKDLTKQMETKSKQKVQEQRQFESEQLDKQIQANKEEQQAERDHETNIEKMKIEGNFNEAYINALGRASDKKSDVEGFNRIEQAQQDIENQFAAKQIGIKESDQIGKQQDRVEQNKIALRNLALKAEELKLKKQKLETDKYIATVNKN